MAKFTKVMELSMKAAQAAGQSFTKFYVGMKGDPTRYRKQPMLADWADVGKIKRKEGRMRYVRKDRRPTAEIAQVKLWPQMSKEYMIKVQVWTQVRPGEPLQERFVNVMADKPLTPAEVEEAVLERLPDWQDSIPGVVARVVPQTIIQRQKP